jgi:glycosyltransferase involved in cell wall biosynthesis
MLYTDITVVVPTRNERHNIPAFLASLPRDISLVVVDASDDETPLLVHQLRPENTVIVRDGAHIAAARQIGASYAKTPWLLFTDADVVFAEEYFAHAGAHIGAERLADAVYGAKRAQGRYAGYYRWFTWGQSLCDLAGVPAVSGSNLLVKRQVLHEIGGFDARLRCNEDSEIGFRLVQRGFRVCFAPDLIVYERDHRRLQRGALRKTVHSLMRCTLLYFHCMPDRWRGQDWGYWDAPKKPRTASELWMEK